MKPCENQEMKLRADGSINIEHYTRIGREMRAEQLRTLSRSAALNCRFFSISTLRRIFYRAFHAHLKL